MEHLKIKRTAKKKNNKHAERERDCNYQKPIKLVLTLRIKNSTHKVLFYICKQNSCTHMRLKPLPYLPPLLGAEDTIWFKCNWRENENYIITSCTNINIGFRLLGGKEKSYKNDKRAY